MVNEQKLLKQFIAKLKKTDRNLWGRSHGELHDYAGATQYVH